LREALLELMIVGLQSLLYPPVVVLAGGLKLA
jgi:hypothetical protein